MAHISYKQAMKIMRMRRIWSLMKQRCLNKKDKNYFRYGGRGISICDEWLSSFNSFFSDMQKSYRDGLTLDRKNNNGNYSKENCRWATTAQQQNNRSCNIMVSVDGRSTSLSNWCRELGINHNKAYTLIIKRLSSINTVLGFPENSKCIMYRMNYTNTNKARNITQAELDVARMKSGGTIKSLAGILHIPYGTFYKYYILKKAPPDVVNGIISYIDSQDDQMDSAINS